MDYQGSSGSDRKYFFRIGSLLQVYRSDVGEGGDTYMERWICRLPGLMLRVHHILRGDKARDLHDHPMSFLSLVLWGGYLEHHPDGRSKFRRPGSLAWRPATTLHRVEILGGPAWTFLIAGRPYRQWGFQTSAGWVSAKDYEQLIPSTTLRPMRAP